jgi:hypothetical protein
MTLEGTTISLSLLNYIFFASWDIFHPRILNKMVYNFEKWHLILTKVSIYILLF